MIKIISNNAEAILEHFHQHLATQKNLSDAMIGGYIAAVREFASWHESYTGQSFHPRHISTSVLIPYEVSLHERGMNSLAIKRHIAMLRRLFKWSASIAPHAPI